MPTDFTGHTFGSYKLVAQLGRGGMATVYRGYQESIDRSVAVKVLPHEYMHDPNFSERFVAEARVLAKLVHPSIMPLYDFGTGEVPYIVMPLMAHGTLADRLARGPLALAEVLRIAVPIASALDYAHQQGVIHRDLKPSNILFDQNDTPYLGDFGIAKALETTSGLTGTGIIGTPDYMSPEQAQGEKIDGRSDLYALAVVVYQLLTGHQLFHATTPMGIVLKHVTEAPPFVRLARPELPEAVDQVLQKALAKRPEDRYQTASEFVAALTAAAGQPATATAYPPATEAMQTMLKPATMSAVPPSQGRPLTPGTPVPPVGTTRPVTPGTPMPPVETTRPVTPGTPMPPVETTRPVTPMPPLTAAPPPARKSGLGSFWLGSGVGIMVGVGVIILLIGACCAGLIGLAMLNKPTPTVVPSLEALLTETPAPETPTVEGTPLPASDTPAAQPGDVLFADDFTDPSTGWEVSNDTTSALGYAQGEYSIKALETNWFVWSNPRRATYSNVRVEVEATEGGRTPSILFGVMCDFQDNQHYYYAGVDTAGDYLIAKHDGEQSTYLSNDGQIQNSSKIARGGSYKLGLECGQGVVALYVDGVLIDAVNDTTYDSGNIGLFLDVRNPDGSDTRTAKTVEARFASLKVTALPETPPTPRPATATPERSPTAGAEARPTATPAAAVGANWIVDSFDNNDNQWGVSTVDDSYATTTRKITGGKYRWTVQAKKGVFSRQVPKSYLMADFMVAVEAQVTSASKAGYGLSFREDSDGNHYYFAVSPSDQTYAVSVYSKGQWTTLIKSTPSTAIRQDQPNWMGVRAEGTHFIFYINSHLVTELDDSALTQAGWAGIAGEVFDKGATADFEFDNFRWGPPDMLQFLDDFTKDQNTWGVKSDADVKRSFKGGQYHITIVKPKTVAWSNLGKTFTDYEVEVETTQVQGPDNNDYGLLLRYQDSDNFYRFVISGAGKYSLDKLKKNEWVTLVDWTSADAIHQGRATNQLRVICQGSTLTFFVNDTRLGDYQDSDFASGDVALAAGKYGDTASAEIAFDNLRIWAVK